MTAERKPGPTFPAKRGFEKSGPQKVEVVIREH